MSFLLYWEEKLVDVLHKFGWRLDCVDGGLCKPGHKNIDLPSREIVDSGEGERVSKLLKPGELIEQGHELWVVLTTRGELRIKVYGCSEYFGEYLDLGGEYILKKHDYDCGVPELWEIPAEQMKRGSGQMMLYIWDDGPGMEVTF